MRKPYVYLVLLSLFILGTVGYHMTAQNPAGGYTSPAQGGTVTPAGSPGAVQYNNSGNLGGFGTFTTGSPNVLALGATQITTTQTGTANPAYIVPSTGAIGQVGGQFIQFSGTDLVLATFGGSNIKLNNPVNATQFLSNTNCNVNSASPAACGAAPAGSFVVPTTTTTYTVNTTVVHAASEIFLIARTDNTNLSGAPTCVAPPTPFVAVVTGRTAGTSFTFTLPSTTGTSCWDYLIFN